MLQCEEMKHALLWHLPWAPPSMISHPRVDRCHLVDFLAVGSETSFVHVYRAGIVDGAGCKRVSVDYNLSMKELRVRAGKCNCCRRKLSPHRKKKNRINYHRLSAKTPLFSIRSFKGISVWWSSLDLMCCTPDISPKLQAFSHVDAIDNLGSAQYVRP